MFQFSVITSKDNSVIKLAAMLQNSGRSRRENGLFVIEGLRLCRDAACNGFKFRYFLFTKDALNRHKDDAEKISLLAEESIMVSEQAFQKISDTKTPQGMLCICYLPKTYDTALTNGKFVALENLSDPSNLGAVSRTAEALGISGLVLSSNGCDPFSPKALRASMGALLRIPVIVSKNFLYSLKVSGLPLYACVVTKDAKPVNEVEFEHSCIAVIGNEANGLTPETIEAATPVTIKMSGKAESLNAAVAASIVMWEMVR